MSPSNLCSIYIPIYPTHDLVILTVALRPVCLDVGCVFGAGAFEIPHCHYCVSGRSGQNKNMGRLIAESVIQVWLTSLVEATLLRFMGCPHKPNPKHKKT